MCTKSVYGHFLLPGMDRPVVQGNAEQCVTMAGDCSFLLWETPSRDLEKSRSSCYEKKRANMTAAR
jgi:hypothetical protein